MAGDNKKGATEQQDTAAKDEVVVVKQEEKKIAVTALKKHSCTIGGADYEFEEKKSYNVPQDVAMILSNAGIVVKQ